MDPTTVPGVDVRADLLRRQDTNVAIGIAGVGKQHPRLEHLDLVQPIIDSLRFERS